MCTTLSVFFVLLSYFFELRRLGFFFFNCMIDSSSTWYGPRELSRFLDVLRFSLSVWYGRHSVRMCLIERSTSRIWHRRGYFFAVRIIIHGEMVRSVDSCDKYVHTHHSTPYWNLKKTNNNSRNKNASAIGYIGREAESSSDCSTSVALCSFEKRRVQVFLGAHTTSEQTRAPRTRDSTHCAS